MFFAWDVDTLGLPVLPGNWEWLPAAGDLLDMAPEGEVVDLSPIKSALEEVLDACTDSVLETVWTESTPNPGRRRRRVSALLTSILRREMGEQYSKARTDASNLCELVCGDLDSTLDLSGEQVERLRRLVVATCSGRLFACASRISLIRCRMRSHCTEVHMKRFDRFIRVFRRSDDERKEQDAVSLARSIQRQTTMVSFGRDVFDATVRYWLSSSHRGLGVLGVMATTGFRFCEVVDPKYTLRPFSEVDSDDHKWGDNVPAPLLSAARLDPTHYCVNRGQAKKRGQPGVECIRPIPAITTASALCAFRDGITADPTKIHNRSVNRALKRWGGALRTAFTDQKRPFTSHSLRGVYVAAVFGMCPLTCGSAVFKNSILGYNTGATSSPWYEVCVCVENSDTQ